ncbi:hypothetical protein C8J57DRAFT_1267809 [Mycena rebaudengoi]|nr:hypothetical protein C8J57DRAFT_1267809 [Mycena rebaudengoi]
MNDDDVRKIISLLNPEQKQTLWTALIRYPSEVIKALAPAITPTLGNTSTLYVIAVWPTSGQTLPLLSRIPFCLHPSVRTARWIIHASSAVLGALSTPEALYGEITLRFGAEPASNEIPIDQINVESILAGGSQKTVYAHIGPTVPYPQPNDWKQGPASDPLTAAVKIQVQLIALGHCRLSGCFAVQGENGHECAHIIPAAISVEAFERFVHAARDIDPSFPLLTGLDDPRNIIYMILVLHKAIDWEGLGIYIPIFDALDTGTSRTTQFTSPIFELHCRAAASETIQHHQLHVNEWAQRFNELRLSDLETDPSRIKPHICAEFPGLAGAYTNLNPWDVSSMDPHPTLLKLHYGVFVAQNYASMELKAIALGGKMRKPEGNGGSGRSGGGSGSNEEDDCDSRDDIEEDDSDEECEEEVHCRTRQAWFHYIMDQAIRRSAMIAPTV